MKKIHKLFAIGFLLVMLACGFLPRVPAPPVAVQITPWPPVLPTAAQVMPPQEPFLTPTLHLDIPALNLDGLRNAEYHLEVQEVPQSIRLIDGLYQQGNDPTAVNYLTVSLNELAAFGDLNEDGIADAAAILGVHQGGTGIEVLLVVVLNYAGLPTHEASALIGDRAIIQSLRIEFGVILVEALVHGPNDPGCCPSQEVTRAFHLNKGTLEEE